MNDLDHRLERARAVCLAAGTKLTQSRQDVLTLLIQAADPVSAYVLLDRLKEKRGVATPPTIYRALNFLLDVGLVHRIERLNAFVACTDVHDHKHPAEFLICRSCGTVAELDDPSIGDAVRQAARQRHFVPANVTVEVEGTCANCAAN